MNYPIPEFECYVRDEFLYDFTQGHGQHTKGVCHAVTTLAGRALGFHVLLDNGAHIGRLPVHAIVTDRSAPPVPLDRVWLLQLWDCFSYQSHVVEYPYLGGMRCRAYLADRSILGGEYLFTIDYYGSSSAERASETGWKCHHIISLDNGWLAALPNNRLCFFDPSFVEPFGPTDPPAYKTMSRTWHCEDGSKWRTEGDKMFYGVEVEKPPPRAPKKHRGGGRHKSQRSIIRASRR